MCGMEPLEPLKFRNGNKEFHPTLYWACDYLSMLGLKLIHVSKRAPRNKMLNSILYKKTCATHNYDVQNVSVNWNSVFSWWRHDMEMLFALLIFMQRTHRSPMVSHHKRTFMQRFDIFFDSMNKMTNKQLSCRWFETSWPACDVTVME